MGSIVSTLCSLDARPFNDLCDTKCLFDKHTFVYSDEMALHSRPALARGGQRSFDDMGVALADATFCVIDLETTGTSSVEDEICEIGAVKVRGGEVLGTFSTFVCPPVPIPGRITVLTGIADSMVRHAPPLTAALPALLEFLGDAIIVGHNVRFDVGFLQAALARHGYDPLDAPAIDTLPLARRLLVGEVPNHRLGTLAAALDLAHQPSHRALADALATADLLHLLIERAAGFGVLALDDLLTLPTAAGHPEAAKLALTTSLPRSGGIYLFRSAAGRVLYVGKAANLRSRTRSYFTSDQRKKVGPLLAQTERIDFKRCESPLESEVLELRVIRACAPPFNRAGTTIKKPYFLRFEPSTIAGGPPRLVVGTAAPQAGVAAIGPVAGRAAAQGLADAIRAAGVSTESLSELLLADENRDGSQPGGNAEDLVAQRLDDAMRSAAAAERFETAARLRDHLIAWSAPFTRAQRIDRLRRAGRIELAWRPPGMPGRALRIDHGILAASAPLPGRSERPTAMNALAGSRTPSSSSEMLTSAARQLSLGSATEAWDWHPVEAAPSSPGSPECGPIDPAVADELLLVARWLERHERHVTITSITGEWLPAPRSLVAVATPRQLRATKEAERAAGSARGRRRGRVTGGTYAPPGQARR